MAFYQIGRAESEDYLICRISGQLTKTDIKHIIRDVQASFVNTGLLDCLVDLRRSSHMGSSVDIYELIHDISKLQHFEQAWAAILTSPEDQSYQFAIIMLQNAGFKLEPFDDELAALKWLGVADTKEKEVVA